MSYIGNQPTNVAFVTDTFSGNGSTTAFTMSVAPATTSSVLVAVTGVLQDPSTYSVSGTTLTFSAAPPSGTSNISVRYLGIPASGVTTTAYRTVTEFTATAGQTSFSVPSYTVGYIDVYRNGVMLGTADFTATTGTTVVLAVGATVGDLIRTESFYVSSVLNAIPATAGAVNSTYIAAGAVGSTQIASGAVGVSQLASSGLSASAMTTGTLPKAQLPAGSILQVIQTVKTDTFGSNSQYPTWADVTGLSVAITPTSASNKILVVANFVGGTSNGFGYFRLARDSTGIFIGDAASNRPRVGSGLADQANTNAYYGLGAYSLQYLDSPATTSSITYKLQISSYNSAGSTTYVNRTGQDRDTTTYDARGASSITVMEVAV